MAVSDVRSVTVAILSFTFFTAVVASSAKALNAVVLTPEVVLTSATTLSLIKARSTALVKSRDLSATLAFGSFAFAALSFTTSATAVNAASNASALLAPAPSAAAANAVTALIICWPACSTASALSGSTPAAYGLKLNGSTPSGRSNTAAT